LLALAAYVGEALERVRQKRHEDSLMPAKKTTIPVADDDPQVLCFVARNPPFDGYAEIAVIKGQPYLVALDGRMRHPCDGQLQGVGGVNSLAAAEATGPSPFPRAVRFPAPADGQDMRWKRPLDVVRSQRVSLLTAVIAGASDLFSSARCGGERLPRRKPLTVNRR
jgi:hypothetical protein